MSTGLYYFIDTIPDTNELRSRSIYDILSTARYPDETIGKYVNGPILNKRDIWDKVGDYISIKERQCVSDIRNDVYYTIRLDGRNFSKGVLPKLRKLGIISSGYSLEFQNAMQFAQHQLFTSIPNAICSFTQSDEITILVGPSRINKNGKRTPLRNLGRFQKYISHAASTVSSTFVISLQNNLVDRGEYNLLKSLFPVEFDARIAQYDSFEAAMQLILWRSYDSAVNGISSGVHFKNLPNKTSLNHLNSTEKLRYLEENGLLDAMTNHQLYGTFMWTSYTTEEKLNDQGESYTRTHVTIEEKSFQLLKTMKSFMCNSENHLDNERFLNDRFNELIALE